jgi:NADPH:quinone reductase-like Zn-dependent oxidoreductase
MKAARRARYGGPEIIRLEDVPVPKPGDDELLVRVHAATVSRTDCAVLAARPFVMRFVTGLLAPRQPTLGTDFAGVVEAVGARVREYRVGDRVWGMNDLGAGSHAEWLAIATGPSVSHMPAPLEFGEAVACIEGGWYAHSVVERVGGVNGARVLVYGATGAIGSALLQLSVLGGATVTAVGNTKNLELLRSLGAARVIDYERQDFTQDDQVYDYVFDAVGKSTFGRCRPLLGPRGVFVSSDLGPGCQNLILPLLTPALRGRRVVFALPVERGAFLGMMRQLASERRFRPVIDRTFALDDVREAYIYAGSGRKTGCVLLDMRA